jgi:predicted amidohydrolase
MIASPWGEILLDAGTDEAVQVVKLDLTEIDKIRAQFPIYAHRRVDLYQTVWKGGS